MYCLSYPESEDFLASTGRNQFISCLSTKCCEAMHAYLPLDDWTSSACLFAYVCLVLSCVSQFSKHELGSSSSQDSGHFVLKETKVTEAALPFGKLQSHNGIAQVAGASAAQMGAPGSCHIPSTQCGPETVLSISSWSLISWLPVTSLKSIVAPLQQWEEHFQGAEERRRASEMSLH